MVVAMM